MQTALDIRTCLVVIEDDADRDWLCGLIGKLPGWRPVESADGIGVEDAIRSGLSPAAVLMGLHLPDYRTARLIERLRQEWPHTEVIAVSSDDGTDCGGTMLSRPYTLNALRAALVGG